MLVRRLNLFAKHWTPGTVKTRLAASIGEAAAAEFHRTSLTLLIRRFRHMGFERHIFGWPPEKLDEFCEVAGSDWSVAAQSAGDLGQRMLAHFQTSVMAQESAVILIGSDSPTLPTSLLSAAWNALEQVDVVIAPSDDGGYCLIGCRRVVPCLFQGIDWGTGSVFQQSISALQAHGISYRELAGWFDVDDFEDLLRLRERLGESPYRDSQWDPLRACVHRCCEQIGI